MTRRILTTTTAVLFTAAVSAGSAFAAGNGPNAPSNSGAQNQSSQVSGQRPQEGQQTAPEGFVLLEENTVYMMAREPQLHLLRAQEQMEANNPKAAASELRLAGAYLKMQEARPGDQAKDVLAHWQQQLHQLAGRVDKGDVKSEELARAAAGANYALANYFDERARDEVGKQGKEVQAGYDLQAAAGCFEQSLIWTGPSAAKGQQSQQSQQGRQANGSQQLREQDVKAIADARSAADRLISAQSLASDQQEGGARPAAARSGPSNTTAGGQNAQASDPQKAADELSKAIQSCRDKFQDQGQASGHDGQKANAAK